MGKGLALFRILSDANAERTHQNPLFAIHLVLYNLSNLLFASDQRLRCQIEGLLWRPCCLYRDVADGKSQVWWP